MLDILTEYANSDYVPMHMPGGKRNSDLLKMDNPYALDITEIDGFDNLHNADGIIKDAFDRCAKVFGAEESLFLVNGSSAGILSAICGATERGDCVIVARNCHISVFNALYLHELIPHYVYPHINEYGFAGAVRPEDIYEACEYHSRCKIGLVKAVIITSPTYEGNVSDIERIAQIAHDFGAVLIVDEAHGAHLNFHDAFPKSANYYGADLVIQSVHKTLPSLTQTALLHMNGDRVDRERVKIFWNIFQSTSPSYVLMAAIDRCVSIVERGGKELFDAYIERLSRLRSRISTLKNIKLYETDDISKIVLGVDDGKALYDTLLKMYHIQCEMATADYVVAMTSICDTDEYYERFFTALQAIDESGRFEAEYIFNGKCHRLKKHTIVGSMYGAMKRKKEYIHINMISDRVSASMICIYPPGVPLVTPGEYITEEDVQIIKEALRNGLEVMGVREEKVLCLR
ncbi:MAG: DegT/DnrJ/EryC1/StrS family aminotransferase [Lachnospira sp.]|nr:DegT/DnrJ/EryC1/StrS family aminotransferase [Lachnospira sp.]